MGNNQTNQQKSQTNISQSKSIQKQQKDIIQEINLQSQKNLYNEEVHNQRLRTIVERENPTNKNIEVKVDSSNETDKKQTHNKEDVEDIIDFQLLCETNQLSVKQLTQFVCGINLQVKQMQKLNERVPMDLICVIDDSGSMGGKKAQLVRKSLKYLLKIMNENDRICLISFDSQEKILTPLLRNKDENKQELKKAIKEITGKGSTNIEIGVEAGLWVIKNRKEKNPVTCMFLLSDGQDDNQNVDLRVQKLINQYNISDTFIVNTYGYGSDHNASQMRNIAETHKGGYYYIEDVKKVSEWFVLSISGLLSAVGENLKIKLKQINQNNVKVNQVYGGDQLWINQNYQKGLFEIELPHLVMGDNKYFAFDCTFDPLNGFELNDNNRQLPIFEAELQLKLVNQEQILYFKTQLKMEFKECQQSEIINNSDKPYFEELMVTHSRAVGGIQIKKANQLIQQSQDYEGAKQLLQQYKVSMNTKNSKLMENNGIKHLDEDIEEAIYKCKPQLFRQASFDKMEVIHCQRRNSISHFEDWNNEQKEVMDKFKNKELCLSDDSCDEDSDDCDNRNVKVSQQNQSSYRQDSRSQSPVAQNTRVRVLSISKGNKFN